MQTLLGEPDVRRKSPGLRYSLALYQMARVEAAEQSDAFKAAQARLAARKTAARKAVATKTAALMAAIDTMTVSVRKISPRGVLLNAIYEYNQWQEERGHYDNLANGQADEDFLARISVNYVRHHLTQYDSQLDETIGKTGKAEATMAIQRKVYWVIAEAYPHLAEECRRQLEEKMQMATRQPA